MTAEERLAHLGGLLQGVGATAKQSVRPGGQRYMMVPIEIFERLMACAANVPVDEIASNPTETSEP